MPDAKEEETYYWDFLVQSICMGFPSVEEGEINLLFLSGSGSIFMI